MRKNVAGQHIAFQMISATNGSAVTTGTPAVYYTIDAGVQGVGAGAAVHEGNGQWSYAPAQAETNGNHVAFTMVLSGAINQTVNVWPVAFDPTDAADLGLSTLTGHVPQSGDSYVRLGAPAGTSISADLLAIDNLVDELESRLTAVRAAYLDNISSGAVALESTAQAILADTGTTLEAHLTDIKGAGWSATTDTLEAIRNRGDAAWITAAGFSTHTAADVWAVATRVLTAGTNIALAKGTGVTGFNDLDAAGIAAAIWNAATSTYGTAGSYGLLIETTLDAPVSGATAPSAAAVADAVWDEAISGHLGAGSTGNALNAAGEAGDPWSTAIPGAYGVGTAGNIVGNNLNAAVSSRASQASVDVVDGIVDAILIDTSELQGDWANGGRLDLIIDAILDDTGTAGVVLTAAERLAIADAILDRNMGAGVDSGSESVRTVRQALRASRNKISIAAGILTITKEDDTTASWTAAVTTSAGNPISAIDPADA